MNPVSITVSALVLAVLVAVGAGAALDTINTVGPSDTNIGALYSFQSVVGVAQFECNLSCTPAQYQNYVATLTASAADSSLSDNAGLLTFSVNDWCYQFDATSGAYPTDENVATCPVTTTMLGQ